MKSEAFTKSYGGHTVLDVPAIEWSACSITAVIGANGSGKSTLAKVLAEIEPSDQKNPPLSGCSIGYMPQKSYAFRLSTARNIALNGSNRDQMEGLMASLHLDRLANQNAKKLSDGETAKMALARILMGRYDLLILDEPTASMDMEATLAAEKLIKEYSKVTSCVVILITHSIQQARRVADEVLFLHDGKLKETGPTEKVLFDPAEAETKRFLEFYGS
jgi:ABC-type multidrug transport system ATPase subunit